LRKIGALIAARNEAATIGETVKSLLNQKLTLDWVVVVVNNTTDDTAQVARQAGAHVFVMTENQHKKAGALNYGLDRMLPEMHDDDIVLVVDADTVVAPNFTQVAFRHIVSNPQAGGVSSVFVGRASTTLLGTLQSMEFYRYKRDIRRHGKEAFVLSGTASAFRVGALRQVKQARNGIQLPEGDHYYDIVSLTEDNEMTLALKTLEYTCPAPGVTSTTDVIETIKDLYHQRHRWYLGALHNLAAYGRKLPVHLRFIYWRQQAGLYMSLLTTLFMTISFGFVIAVALAGVWTFSAIWLIPSVVLLVERVATVWKMGWRERVIAALLLPEMCYSLFLLGTFASAAATANFAKGHQGSWQAT
jgi:cellulose synthase/poly-beta-1,6-N-acetylglucosamine synthase-like glycosyltransferase